MNYPLHLYCLIFIKIEWRAAFANWCLFIVVPRLHNIISSLWNGYCFGYYYNIIHMFEKNALPLLCCCCKSIFFIFKQLILLVFLPLFLSWQWEMQELVISIWLFNKSTLALLKLCKKTKQKRNWRTSFSVFLWTQNFKSILMIYENVPLTR